MSGFFSTEGKLYGSLNLLTDLVLLNIVWILTSIPVVTIGASSTALWSVVIKMLRKEDPSVIREFFIAFRKNFKEATLIWLGVMGLGALAIASLAVCGSVEALRGMRLVLMITFALFAGIVQYLFPMIAVFRNPYQKTIKNAVILAVAHLPQTILMLFVGSAPFFIAAFMTEMLFGVFLCLVVLFSFSVWINAHFICRMFQRWMPEAEDR